MPKPLKETISVRFTVWVVSFVAILFVAALTIMFLFSRQTVCAEALAKASLILENTVQNIDYFLRKVEVATTCMHRNVESHLDDIPTLEVYCRQLLKDNPAVVGCRVSMVPYFYPEKGKEFMIYVYRSAKETGSLSSDSTILQSHQYGKSPYLIQNWYVLTVGQDSPCWIKPTENNAYGQKLASYCIPLHRNGKVVGVFSVDILLDMLSSTILNTKPFPHSYCSVIGRRGTYIIHPDTVKLHQRTVYDLLENSHDPRMSELIQAIMVGESGHKSVEIDGREGYVFYKPFRHKGWVASVVCPKSDVLANNIRLQTSALLIVIVGLIFLMVFCLLFLRRILGPLNMLAKTARRLAEGHYEESVPLTARQDEIGSMQNSFHAMQHSIVHYLDDIKQMNDVLKESNEALAVANEQAQEAERVMNAFIVNMTDQMTQPIEIIEKMVTDLRQNNGQMGQESISEMTDELQKHTSEVTDLLDRMLEVSQRKGGHV